MSHAVFTIVTEVLVGHEDFVGALLLRIEQNHAGNGLIDLPSFPGLHFASFTLFPADPARQPAQRSLLVFEHNVDGSWRAHIAALLRTSEPGLREIYRHCAGCPADDSQAAFQRYLERHVKHPNLHHVGTPYRTVDTIRDDQRLRAYLEQRADLLAARPQPGTAAGIWDDLRSHRPAAPVPEPRAWTRLVNWLYAVAIAVVAWTGVSVGVKALWTSPLRLSVALVTLYFFFGVITGLLLGWPVFAWDREPLRGETARETRRALLHGWRTTVNIWIWFAAVGWAVSLVPPALRLAGVHLPWRSAWPAAIVLALITIVVLVFMVGQWSLPTPELARPTPARDRLAALTAQEDVRVTNHMSALVVLRPGRIRRTALRVLLWTLERTWFHTYLADVLKGRLFNFATVHFAQWVVLDQERYVFLSNYDHSFSRYLDDFGNISFGLARLWGMGARSPGLSNLERYKDFARTWMTPCSVWYSAYPGLAVTQVWNNEALRRGLTDERALADPAEMLQRLVKAGER